MENFLINGEKDDFEIVVGLEIHAQVNSNAKLFSGSSTDFGSKPNENKEVFVYEPSFNTVFKIQEFSLTLSDAGF